MTAPRPISPARSPRAQPATPTPRQRVDEAKQRLLVPNETDFSRCAESAWQCCAQARKEIRQHPFACLALGAATGFVLTRYSGLLLQLARSRAVAAALPIAARQLLK